MYATTLEPFSPVALSKWYFVLGSEVDHLSKYPSNLKGDQLHYLVLGI